LYRDETPRNHSLDFQFALTNNELPLQSYANRVTALAPQAQIQTSSNSAYFDMPYRTGQVGSDKDQVQLTFGTSVKGKMAVTVRCD
jgi:hypothetical protein